jgi:hypothetical protein
LCDSFRFSRLQAREVRSPAELQSTEDGDDIAGHAACPDLAEDMDGYEDQDGCPERDNDLDAIVDERPLSN